MSNLNSLLQGHEKQAATLFTIGLVSGAAWYYFNKWRTNTGRYQIPSNWEEVGEVDQLLIYPLKSAKAIPLKSADSTSTGLQEGNLADRSFMTINENKKFITGREAKLLVTLKTKFEDNTLTVTAMDGTSVSVNVIELCKGNPEITRFTIRGDAVQGIDCGDEMSKFLTRVVEKKLRLVYMGLDEFQRAKRNYGFFDFPMFQENDTSRYFDNSTYMMMTVDSMKDLNSRVKKQVDFDYFRPTIVAKGMKPFDEDNWEFVKIGDTTIFHATKPCERCILTTIDPATGIYNKEHMEELLKYRTVKSPPEIAKQWKLKPVFGLLLGIDVTGRINVGDKIYVSRYKNRYYEI